MFPHATVYTYIQINIDNFMHIYRVLWFLQQPIIINYKGAPQSEELDFNVLDLYINPLLYILYIIYIYIKYINIIQFYTLIHYCILSTFKCLLMIELCGTSRNSHKTKTKNYFILYIWSVLNFLFESSSQTTVTSVLQFWSYWNIFVVFAIKPRILLQANWWPSQHTNFSCY